MDEFIIRKATGDDIPFLVETIIEAEKSGTDKLSYSTVFGLSDREARKYLGEMLLEEIDDCEISISSFIIAEKNGQIVAASSAWIEGLNGTPSSVLKGNLLGFILPNECIRRAASVNHIIRELHIECVTNTFQLGLVYVSSLFRGMNLAKLLIHEQIKHLSNINSSIKEMYIQVFGNNIPAINAYKKVNFVEVISKESHNKEVFQYLPSDKKILMKKNIY
jgi:ribosomal protein S18 acetylase RimI-like enzyme